MTQAQFFKELRTRGRGKFVVQRDSAIRTRRRPKGYSGAIKHCPLSFLAGTSPCSVYSSAGVLGVSVRFADRIAHSADEPKPRKTRKMLLRALGLKERKA